MKDTKIDTRTNLVEVRGEGYSYRFPLSIFPPMLQQLIIEANKACNFPVSYMGASMLFSLSTAIGNTCTLRVKRNRQERCILYLHLVGEPGSVKSHPLRFALQPIIDRDIKNRKEYQKQYEKYLKELQEGANPEKPVCRQRLIHDATPEAMMKIMSENPAGVCVFCDEVSTFHSNIGRYNKSGFDSMMLSLFDCQPIFIDRSGNDAKITLDTPFGNFGGGRRSRKSLPGSTKVVLPRMAFFIELWQFITMDRMIFHMTQILTFLRNYRRSGSRSSTRFWTLKLGP